MINFNQRMNTLTTRLKQEGADLAIIMDPSNIFYFTGFNSDPHERFMGLIINLKTEKYTLFVPALDESAAAEASAVQNIVTISDEQDPFEIVQSHISKEGISNIYLEKGYINIARYEGFQNIFDKSSYHDMSSIINEQRLIKSRQEIEYLQEAVDIIEKVLSEGIKKVKVGMTELELTGELELLMKKYGAIGPSFSTTVLSGEKAALPHGSPGERQFKNGDFLLIDFGVITQKGYCSDMTRTFIIGEADEKQKSIYNIVKDSNQAALDLVKSGVPLKEFDIAAREVIKQNGYGEYFNNRVGHGLGIEVHEAPSIHEHNEAIAKAGLFFTIEPGIYIPDYGGVRIEDEVYINENGEAEILTSFPRDLRIL